MRLWTYIGVIIAQIAFLTALATNAPVRGESALRAESGDVARGKELYERRCIACHSLDANRVGPKHRGVYGRRAGSAEGYAYSPALRQAQFVWDAETLDLWLQDPEALVPGQRMNVRVTEATDRADIIAYLKAQTGGTLGRGRDWIDYADQSRRLRDGM